eukprot:scaffold18099_cov112-Isochrysis_galbana.AAC.12
MAPLQLRLEPTEVVMATDKGAARARVYSTDESSPQPGACTTVESKVVHELNKPRRDEPAACTVANPFGSRSTPLYYHSFGCPLQHPPGFSKIRLKF